MTERARDFATKLWKRGTEVAKQQTRILLLQGEIARSRDQKNRLLLQMGQKVYALFEKDLVKNADLRAFCEQARALDDEIARHEAEIEQLRAADADGPADGDAGAETPAEAADVEASTPPSSVADLKPPPSEPTHSDPGDAFLRGEAPSESKPSPDR